MPEVVFFTIVGLFFLFAVISTVKKQKSFEKESFYWVIAAVGILLLALNSDIIIMISELVNIKYPPSLLFLISTVFILYLLFKITVQIGNLREQNKELAQEIVILKTKLEKMKKNISKNNDN